MKTKILILTLALICSYSINCFAHTAKAIRPEFNIQTRILKVQIIHTTTAPQIHHIYKVKTTVEGKKVKEELLPAQKNSTEAVYTTQLRNVDPGDVINITAYCNRGGAKTATIVASGEKITAVPRAIQKKKSSSKKIMPKKPAKRTSSRSAIPEKKTPSYKRIQEKAPEMAPELPPELTPEKAPEVAPEKPAKKKSRWF